MVYYCQTDIKYDETDLMYWYLLAKRTIIAHQDPVTGLIPAHPGADTWVRDCTYSIHSIWALSLAFEKNCHKNFSSICHELRFRTIKALQGLLNCLMTQKDKVDKFISTECYSDCLHAKYNTATGKPVVGDNEWGHLQLDATSLFVLTLAQITSSGYVIAQSQSEVEFIQSLVLYIHLAYRTPDFGVYERGDKNNRGIRELGVCSVGMAKAALVAMRDLNLFGGKGGPQSIIHIPPDMSRKCNSVLQSILPRGSKSKEFDSSTFSIISYPAFAVESDTLINCCKELLIDNLKGNYGYKRFLLDGFKCALEDKQRLHYELGELKSFAQIECEWPLYLIYEWIDELFNDNFDSAHKLKCLIKKLIVLDEEGYSLVPELYFVPSENIEEEKNNPGSQLRLCGGKIPFFWGQSLFIVANLLHNKMLSTSDIDPLNRRLSMIKQPVHIVQILLFSENESCQQFADCHKFPCIPICNTIFDVITPPVVTKMWEEMGLSINREGGLNQFGPKNVSSLRSSIVYEYEDKRFISLPEYSLESCFYNNLDNEIFIQETVANISHLSNQWYLPGRPILAFLLTSEKCKEESTLRFLNTLNSGSYQGIQVKLCNSEDALSTSFKNTLTVMPSVSQTSIGYFISSKETIEFSNVRNLHFCNKHSKTFDEEIFNDQLTSLSIREKWKALNNCMQADRFLPTEASKIVMDLYQNACKEKDWFVVRHCSSLLCHVNTSICDDVTHILVNQNQISFGTGQCEETISQPPTATMVIDLLIHHSKNKFILFALYQEILCYLCQMIKKNTTFFKGIMTIRMDRLIWLIAKETSNDECDFEKMCRLTPIEMYNLVYQLFSGGISVNESGMLSWEARRYIDGSLNRVPTNFHQNLYSLLCRTSGIDLNGNFLASFPIVNEMTVGEPQFAIAISNWLDKTSSPQLRQLYVEAIMIFGSLVKMLNVLPKEIHLHAFLLEAHSIFQKDIGNKKLDNLLCGISKEFLLTPPTGQYGTLNYFAQAVAQLAN